MYVHNLSSAFAGMDLCPSSAIDRLEFETDSDRILLSLLCGSDEFYRSTLYAYDGSVTVERMDQVIGDYLLARSLHRADITVRAIPPEMPSAMALMDIDVIYCSYTLPEGFDLSAAFWSLLQIQRVPHSARLPVYGDMNDSEVSFRVSGFKSDGTPDSCELAGYSSEDMVWVDIPAISKLAARDHGISKVTSVSLFCGDVVKSFLLIDMPSFLEFRFRNCFNCPETVYVSGVSEMVTDVSRDQAVCNGRTMQYNHQVSRSYKHTTDPLTRLEAAALSQLVEARETYVRIDLVDYPVIVTDHELKVSNDDSSLNHVKFTWRFADSRPRLFGSTLTPLLESYGIFTDQFTEPYQ